jgi:glycosyltransferase involved in cell wall biosynthesis
MPVTDVPSRPLHEVLVSHLVGGAAVVAMKLGMAARRRGRRCTTWIPGLGPAAAALDAEQLPRRLYDFEAMRAGSWRQVRASLRMLPGLVSIRPPLVHIHTPTAFGVLRPALALARARAVVHVHSVPTREEIAWMLKSQPAHIITCARHIATTVNAAVREHGATVPVTAIPNAVDLDRFQPGDRSMARAAAGLPTDRFVVLMLANLAPGKGQEIAMRAVAQAASRGVPVECWLVGEDRSDTGAHRRDLESLRRALALEDCVRFLGFRDDAARLLQAADVFLLPSKSEGLPLSVLEAQAARVPVIGAAIPGIQEVVEDGRTGLLVNGDDPGGYAERLQLLYREPDTGARLADAAASQVAREHSWSVFEERIFSTYDAVG